MQLLSCSSVSTVSLGTGSDTLSRGSCQGCGVVCFCGCREMFPAGGMVDVSDFFSVPQFPFPSQVGGRWNCRARLFWLSGMGTTPQQCQQTARAAPAGIDSP